MKVMTSILLAVAMMVACDNTISYDSYSYDYEDITTENGSGVGGEEQPGDEVEPGGDAGVGILAQPANRFLESIGMNSSLDSRGENKASTAACMNYLGARWLRCGYGSDTDEVFGYLIDNVPNIRFSMSVGTGGNHTDKKFTRILDVAKYLKSRNALIALEGANEPNNWGIWYDGKYGGGPNGDWTPVAQMHSDFYEVVKADPYLKDVDVWSITCAGAQDNNVGLQFLTIPSGAGCLMPAGTRFADVVNVHNYFSHPSFPAPKDNQTWIASDPSSNCMVDGLYGNNGKTWRNKYQGYSEQECMTIRKVTTETGIVIGGAVTEKMQGLMYITCYLAQFARGWEYTSMYILRDRSDEAGNQTFGFYTTDYQPRLAAHYMHNLTTILKDDTSIKNPGKVNYTINGKTQMVHDLLLQKNDGTFALVVWGEYYQSGQKADVKVDLGAEYENVTVYNPITGLEAVQTLNTASEVSLTLTNEPYIILFK